MDDDARQSGMLGLSTNEDFNGFNLPGASGKGTNKQRVNFSRPPQSMCG